MPEIAFHEIPQQAWKELGIDSDSHWNDPTFDLTWVSHAPTTTVLSSIGFEAIDVWSDLKGFPAAYKVPIVDTVVLRVSRITVGMPQMIDLADPIAIEAGSVVRLKLTLMGFRANLAGNESLVRLRAIANDELHLSRLINMGVLNEAIHFQSWPTPRPLVPATRPTRIQRPPSEVLYRSIIAAKLFLRLK